MKKSTLTKLIEEIINQKILNEYDVSTVINSFEKTVEYLNDKIYPFLDKDQKIEYNETMIKYLKY